MPGLVHKLVVIAAIDGLVLQPIHQRNQRAIHVSYKSHKISPSGAVLNTQSDSFDCHGIVGFLTVAPFSYLVAITARQQVARIRNVPIYVVTDVALIPLSSQKEASAAIKHVRTSLKKRAAGQKEADSDTDTSDDDGRVEKDTEDDGHVSPISTESSVHETSHGSQTVAQEKRTSNVAEDVIGKKGLYGRFAERWFSKNGWSAERRRSQGMSAAEVQKPMIVVAKDDAARPDDTTGKSSLDSAAESAQGPDATEDRALHDKDLEKGGLGAIDTDRLLPKLLRTTRLLLASRSFFFSYDFDITRRLGTAASGPKGSDLPLHKCVDPLFFWNYHLSEPLIEGGHHAFVLPLMQGFVGQRAFTIDKRTDSPSEAISHAEQNVQEVIKAQDNVEEGESSTSFLITLISRRSIKRPGLRYLRRGVDEEGNTANSVETEQILSKTSWTEKIYSFTQFRGSIPLFFQQSPYSFKPVPVLQHSPETNQEAIKRHFNTITGRYGDVQIVLLVDKTGGEREIGERYKANVSQLNEEHSLGPRQLGFEWFDFHNICRGMKFENVSLLMDALSEKMDSFGETIEIDGSVQKEQTGIARTNCMDCLDRTNVVQSAFGQRALEQQLHAEGFSLDLRTDITTQWFNTLWADNGDAISKQYSSTAALKGDYTRTRQRNYRGAINDLGLTLSRYFNNIVNDYFSQAAIDYLLGTVTAQVFEDFEEKMMSSDPGMSMPKVRENAITTASKIVIEDPTEEFVAGWTLLSPPAPNTLRAAPFEEAILLLTDAALYRVSFDWTSDTVLASQRVDLRSVTGITKGVYITAIHTASQTDEHRNVGFVLRYRPGKGDVARVNTRSLSSAITDTINPTSSSPSGKEENESILAAAGSDIDSNTNTDTTTKEEKQKENKTHVPSSTGDTTTPSTFLAFKALPARSSVSPSSERAEEGGLISERELVSHICAEIERVSLGGGDGDGGGGLVREGEVVGVEEARRSTGLVEQWGHSLKRLVWG